MGKPENDLNDHLKKMDEDESRENEIFQIVRDLTESDCNDGAPEFKDWARRRAEKSLMEKL